MIRFDSRSCNWHLSTTSRYNYKRHHRICLSSPPYLSTVWSRDVTLHQSRGKLPGSRCCGSSSNCIVLQTFQGLVVIKDKPQITFPDTLEGFGYHFNDKGELVDKEGVRFKFVVKEGDHSYNQQHYEALGEVVTEHLYQMMCRDLSLMRDCVPIDASLEEPQSFIFRTEDALQNSNLMVIIHGSGFVRAGQWSRKLIINRSIDPGSQLPYVRQAISDGYGVIVMNSNLNKGIVDGKVKKIQGNANPEEHGRYVWEHIVRDAQAENIAIVAHSNGGLVTYAIADQFEQDFKDRVFSAVYTDTVYGWSVLKQSTKDLMRERAVNFVCSRLPLDTEVQSATDNDCQHVSAGTTEHEEAPHSCISSAFKFIHDNHATWTKDRTMAPRNFRPSSSEQSQST